MRERVERKKTFDELLTELRWNTKSSRRVWLSWSKHCLIELILAKWFVS